MRYGSAGVYDSKDDALVLLYPDWNAVAQHAVVDGRIVVGRVHRSVRRGSHVGIPIVQGEKDFLIVGAGFVLWLDVEAAELP